MMQHTLRRTNTHWYVCSCSLFAVLGSNTEEANAAHRVHVDKEATDPTPVRVQTRAQVYNIVPKRQAIPR